MPAPSPQEPRARPSKGSVTATRDRARYPIRAVSKLTGIGMDTLRAWERRYGAVTPTRDQRGRLYSEADVARLRLIHQAVAGGHSVGRVANLKVDELRRLGMQDRGEGAMASDADLSTLIATLQKFDGAALDRELSRLAALLPPFELVRNALLPTLREVGDRWHRRADGIAHEHMMSAAMRHLLGTFLRLYGHGRSASRLLFATPTGERHEIGILGAAMLAASQGFSVSYVGPDLPAREVVEAVNRSEADVLVLGLTLTQRDRLRVRELRTILGSLPTHVEVWVGGPGTGAYAALLDPRGIAMDLDGYMGHLARLSATR
jgi:methanogenic corrinoid protein MtbC1